MDEHNKILVIDDEVSLCEGIQRALQLENFQVDLSFDGQTGMEKVREGGYDLVLIDVMIPDVSGIDLISAIHKVDPEIVCVIITGYATIELAVQAIKRGAYDFLTKPFSVESLLLAIRQGLERRKLSREAQRVQAAEEEVQRLADEKKRLEELDRAKRQFIRLVTHELQAPVSAIENYLKLIQDGYIPPEEQPEILEKCMHRTQEERALIADLLELGHLEVLETFKKEDVNLGEVLQTVMDASQEEIKQKDLHFEVQIAPDLPDLKAAPEQIKSLWNNLINNAIKYTPKHGSISIQLGVDQGNIFGSVRDTGIGIPPEDQSQIFSEFHRAHNAKELEIPGTGLGLAIVKRIVEGLNGTLVVDSEIGQGSVFSFRIPLDENEPINTSSR